jgi:uncharacterized protein
MIVLAALIAAVGATIQGTVGFGFALFAAPLASLLEPALVPGPMLAAVFVLTLLMAGREWQSVDLGSVKWALVGRVPGVVGGALLFAALSGPRLEVLFGVLVLIGVVMTVSGFEIRPSRGNLFLAGLLSGFMGTTASIGGPPMALVYQNSSGPDVRGTLSGYFLISVIMSLIALVLVGRFGRAELVLASSLLPGVLVGFFISRHGARWLDVSHARVRAGVLIVSVASALLVIGRQLVR